MKELKTCFCTCDICMRQYNLSRLKISTTCLGRPTNSLRLLLRKACTPSSKKVTTIAVMRWQDIASTASQQQSLARSGHCSAILPDLHEADIIAFGGYTENESLQRTATNEAFLFHHGSWHMVTYTANKLPRARLVTQATIIDNHLYIIGGWDPGNRGDGGDILGDVWKLNLADYSWSEIKVENDPDVSFKEPGLQPTSRHQIFAVGSLIYIHNHRTLDYLLTLDVSKDPAILSTIPVDCTRDGRPTARGLHTLTLVANKAYLFGGAKQRGGMMGDIWQLDLEAKAWSRLAPGGRAPHVRCSHTATLIDNQIWFFGGSFSNRLIISNTVTASEYMPIWGPSDNEPWPEIEPDVVPRARNAHISANLDGQLLISGGWDPFKKTYNDTLLLSK